MSGPLAEFLEHLREGRFMLQRRLDTGRHVFYPRHVSGVAWEWVAASGQGTVYSATIIRQKPERGGDFAVALVELAEGPRMMARIIDTPPEAVRIGQPVCAVVTAPDWNWKDGPVVAFRPLAEETAA